MLNEKLDQRKGLSIHVSETFETVGGYGTDGRGYPEAQESARKRVMFYFCGLVATQEPSAR